MSTHLPYPINPAAVGVTHERLRLLQGDVLDPAAVALSAVPVGPRSEATPVERVLVYPILYRLFGALYGDMARMEEVLRDSDVDWTVLRPPRLTDKPATGRYRLGLRGPLRGARTVSRADLADAMLRIVDEPGSVRATVAVAN